MVVFDHKEMNIDSFKHCTLAAVTDGSEDLLIHWLKHNQPRATGLDRLPIISDHDLGKLK